MVALFGIEQERQSVVLVRDRTSAGLHSIRGLGWRKSAWQKNEFGLDVRRCSELVCRSIFLPIMYLRHHIAICLDLCWHCGASANQLRPSDSKICGPRGNLSVRCLGAVHAGS